MIWDFAGNVDEWIYDDYSSLGVSLSSGWKEYNSVDSNVRDKLGPSNASWSSTQGIGQINGGSAGAVHRGGRWIFAAFVGVFNAGLGLDPTVTTTGIGFRCSFAP